MPETDDQLTKEPANLDELGSVAHAAALTPRVGQCPVWEDQPEVTRRVWRAVALAVWRRCQ